LRVDVIPKRVERFTERQVYPLVQGEQAADEIQPAPDLAELVVHNDVPRFSFSLQLVPDEGRGFQDQRVGNGAWHNEDAGPVLPVLQVMAESGHCGAEQPFFQTGLNAIRPAARASGEE